MIIQINIYVIGIKNQDFSCKKKEKQISNFLKLTSCNVKSESEIAA